MELQAQPRQHFLDALPELDEPAAIVVEQDKIVAVAQIAADPELRRQGVIEAVEIPVGEPLASQVADGKAAAPLRGREQVVAGEVNLYLVLLVGAVHDHIQKGEQALVLDEAAEGLLQDGVIDTGEKLADVALER